MITVRLIRQEYLDTLFYRASKNIFSTNGKYEFITYIVNEKDFEELFHNIDIESKALKTSVSGDIIHFSKRGFIVRCYNETQNERIAFAAL